MEVDVDGNIWQEWRSCEQEHGRFGRYKVVLVCGHSANIRYKRPPKTGKKFVCFPCTNSKEMEKNREN